jgi:hypothetical protein
MRRNEHYRNKKEIIEKGCKLTGLVTKLLKNRQNWHLGAESRKK